jgi:hypothetical protein
MIALTERRTMGDEIIYKRHDNSKVDASAEAWRNFFLHAFTDDQSALLCEMLSRCIKDWSGEWRKDMEDVALAIQDVLFDQFDKAVKEVQTQRRTIDEIRGQMSVLLSGKTIDSNVIEMPNFLEGKARVTKAAAAGHDALVERLDALERLCARVERQAKTMMDGWRTDRRAKEAMSQRLTKRVDRLEGRMMKVEKDVEQ